MTPGLIQNAKHFVAKVIEIERQASSAAVVSSEETEDYLALTSHEVRLQPRTCLLFFLAVFGQQPTIYLYLPLYR